MISPAFCGILSIVIMISAVVVHNGFASIAVFVLGLLLLVAALCAVCELKYAHRAGNWPSR